MAEKKIKVGLVGIGRAGWGMHVRDLEKKQDKGLFLLHWRT